MSEKKDGIVLVTGASGFIALHIIQLLQKEGFRVRGTVRNLKNEAKVKPLLNLCPDAKYPLELVEADLTSDAGWDEAVKGCRYCIHVASPFPNAPPKREEDLMIPAVEGTKRVLTACSNAGTVKRIVLTSSISSVHGESTNEEGRIYCEDDWSDMNSRALDAYGKSKTVAEKTAWDFIRSLPPEKKMELATVNPSLVMGPSISGVVCTSLELVKRLMDGSMPLIPRMYIAICDVRDVARAHLQAMIVPEAANNRHIVNSGHLWLQDIAHILRNEFSPQGYFIPTWPAPYFALWIYSCVDSSTRLILQRINQTYTFSNRRMKEVLKIEPRKTDNTLVDTVYGMIECGVIKKSKHYVGKK
ncbi:putative uncharacterized oxidoreductase YDR541C [Trichonephila inaurata madagascariensis]|uniref:Uncharacterized oxidoreductase YDR541C n=1 Tax=Trichonephila inaurata madagascariensis TaxID=2747483 RepID=A0A8X7CD10_9ARAC|nr:putative uncharacterized oxidoreductase YDR541C [Trichonephila inaurata madagascariensis]